MCEAPEVNGDIGFFDGLDSTLVFLIIFIAALFSIVFQYYKQERHKLLEEEYK